MAIISRLSVIFGYFSDRLAKFVHSSVSTFVCSAGEGVVDKYFFKIGLDFGNQ